MLNQDTHVTFLHSFQYQASTKPVLAVTAFDGWFKPFSEPVKKISWATVLIAASGFSGPNTKPIVAFDWQQQLAELIRQKPGLVTANQQQPTWSTFTPAPETITLDKWYSAWREPAKPKVSLPANSQQFVALPSFPPIVSYSWNFSQTDLAPRAKQGLGVYNQLNLAWSTFTPAGETITLDKWYAAWREPVRQKVSLHADLQQALAFVKAAPFPEAVFESKWHQPWSEPVRRLPPLRTASETAMVPFTLPYAIVSFGWYTPQTELPPRQKPGLGSQYQQAFTTDSNPVLHVADITGILSALETKDIFLGGGFLFAAPFRVLTGVIEKKFTGGLSGITEESSRLG